MPRPPRPAVNASRAGARAGALLLVATLLLAGCLGPAQAPVEPTGGAEPGKPERPPPRPMGPPVVLRPASDFVEMPWGYVRSDFTAPTEALPAIFVMDGYKGASQPHPTHYLRMRDSTLVAVSVLAQHPLLPTGYVLAWASIRGTGCSAGTFDLFDRAHAFDGYEIIEWLAEQPWTTGKVGLFGASYSGITAFHIASTQPPSLAAMSANMVIDDLYRGIAYPGGVPNMLFPALWTVVHRPEADAAGTLGGAEVADEVCAQNVAARRPGYPADNPTLVLFTRTLDDPTYQLRSLITHAEHIKVPTYISHAWQDEQTGPRGGPVLFNAIHPEPVLVDGVPVEPKKLVATNGVHATAAAVAIQDAQRWFDHWLRGIDTGMMREAPVKLLFGTQHAAGFNYTSDGTLELDGLPAPGTEWRRFYFGADGALAQDPPQASAAPDSYAAGNPRQSWFFLSPTTGSELAMSVGPDVLTYQTEPLAEPRVLVGPIAATLYLSTTAPDTDLFVSVADVDALGEVTYLARGMLRASHRALDPDRTLYNAQGDIIIPHHPHTNPQPVDPGRVERYDLEVFPLAHIFYAGHRLQVQVHTPPLSDGSWGYNPLRAPGVNTLHHDAEYPSSMLLPFLPWPGELPPEPACGAPDGYRCIDTLADAKAAAALSKAPRQPLLGLLG